MPASYSDGNSKKRPRASLDGSLKDSGGCACFTFTGSEESRGGAPSGADAETDAETASGGRILNISAAPSLLCSPSLLQPTLAVGSSSSGEMRTYIDEVGNVEKLFCTLHELNYKMQMFLTAEPNKLLVLRAHIINWCEFYDSGASSMCNIIAKVCNEAGLFLYFYSLLSLISAPLET